MKQINTLCLVSLLVVFSHCNNKAIVTPPTDGSKLRVLGYLHSPWDWVTGINSIDLSGITDLNLAFINPDSTGKFEPNTAYHEVIRKAHDKQVKVFLSFGGGSAPAYLEQLMEEANRPAFISGLISVAETYGFDGIDVDLENALINQHYADFVYDLAIALKPKNKTLTAALASWNANQIHDTTLARYDFINVMSYDKTGPWNLSRPGQHSPFSMAQDDFNYFNQTRKIAAEKIFIGLPFYGYGFGSGAPSSMTYKNIISTYTGAHLSDSITLSTGGKIYYNGIPTIQQKVSLAVDRKAGGVMIWQLLGDSNNEHSLLKAINEVKNR